MSTGHVQQQRANETAQSPSADDKEQKLKPLKEKPKEQVKTKRKMKDGVGRVIFLSRESAGGYQKEPTDVQVNTRGETHILKQHLAVLERECEDEADGFQASVEVGCSLSQHSVPWWCVESLCDTRCTFALSGETVGIT